MGKFLSANETIPEYHRQSGRKTSGWGKAKINPAINNPLPAAPVARRGEAPSQGHAAAPRRAGKRRFLQQLQGFCGKNRLEWPLVGSQEKSGLFHTHKKSCPGNGHRKGEGILISWVYSHNPLLRQLGMIFPHSKQKAWFKFIPINPQGRVGSLWESPVGRVMLPQWHLLDYSQYPAPFPASWTFPHVLVPASFPTTPKQQPSGLSYPLGKSSNVDGRETSTG